jgi:hypothetical protein
MAADRSLRVITHVIEMVHGTEDNGLEGDQDETFRQQRAQLRLS